MVTTGERDAAAGVAAAVVAAYADCGALSFCYGQGSFFAGLATDSDLDIVMIWSDAVPVPAQRPADRLGDAATSATRFDQLDKIQVSGWPVDVAHHTRAAFDGWLDDVRQGDGWQQVTWPMPLYAVSGFTYGVVLTDPYGHAGQARQIVARCPAALAERSRETLRADWPSYDRELSICVRRDDGLLFHQILSRVLRHTYVAWFAAHGAYCPHPKRFSQWLDRFGMERHIAELDRRIWRAATLTERHALAGAMVDAVLALPARAAVPRRFEGGYGFPA